MPEGTFIPILTTFRSITDSRRNSTEISQNLMKSFDKVPLNSDHTQADGQAEMQPSTSAHIDIRPRTLALTISASPLSENEEGTGLMFNQMTQTVGTDMPTCKKCRQMSLIAKKSRRKVHKWPSI